MFRSTLIVASFAAAVAGAQAPKSPTPAERLKPLAFLVGTWSGDAPAPDKPSELFVIAPMYDGNFVRMTATMSAGGKVVYTDETTYGWDDEAKKLFGITLGQGGMVGRALAAGEPTEGKAVFESTRTVGGVATKIRGTIEKVDADTLKATVEVQKDGEYRVLKSSKYNRVK